jgi:hypothetical protein
MSSVQSGSRSLRSATVFAIAAGLATTIASAQDQTAPKEPLADAWWTGPMLANTAGTAPAGHLLVETYLYDQMQNGRFDAQGNRHPAPSSSGYGTLTYLVYAVADRVGVGLLPSFGYNTASGSPASTGPGFGDVGVFAQIGLTQFRIGSWVPTTAFNLQETFPTGTYDHLGDRPTNGFGSGTYTTMASLYSQTYFWLPTGRILRVRLNFSDIFASHARVDDASVYGTADGFHGSAAPGNTFVVNAAAEYSLTSHWVLASDLVYRHYGNTRVEGTVDSAGDPLPSAFTTANSGTSRLIYVAPALEYNWNSRLGLLLGVRVAAAGRNTAQTITPALAINIVD